MGGVSPRSTRPHDYSIFTLCFARLLAVEVAALDSGVLVAQRLLNLQPGAESRDTTCPQCLRLLALDRGGRVQCVTKRPQIPPVEFRKWLTFKIV